MKKFLIIMAIGLLSSLSATAQIRGYLETFSQHTSATSWLFSTEGDLYYPAWTNNNDDYFIWAAFMTEPGWMFADQFSSGGKFVGDYLATEIQAISVEVFLDYPNEVAGVEIFINSGYNNTNTYYYYSFPPLTTTAWYQLTAPLNTPEWWITSTTTGYLPPTALSMIKEVGVVAYPMEGLPYETYINIDNFVLLPRIIVPTLQVTNLSPPPPSSSDFPFQFLAQNGQAYRVFYNRDLTTTNWNLLPGYTFIAGGGTNFTVRDTNVAEHCYYAIESTLHITQ